MVFRTRFAPSPTGFLHLGHAFSAMTAYEAAQAEGGDFLLRIEDIDHTRCRPLFEQAIFDDLAWLGIDWPRPVLRQSEHIGDYQAALERLRDMGVVHADARTRRSTAEAALSAPQEGSPSGDASMDTAATHPAWRLSLEEARRVLGARYDALSFTEGSIEQKAVPETNGDVVLGRKDIGVAYHLCVVIDDARQGISHVIRGRDLIDATHTQVLLQALLDLPTPQYRHHALLLDDEGRRLAKRKGSKSLRDFRAEGLDRSAIRDLIAAMPQA